MFLAGEQCSPLLDKAINYANTQKKKSDALSAISFAYAGAKEKAIKKKTPRRGDFALCGVRQRLRAFDGAAF